jgi:hypothetical protein
MEIEKLKKYLQVYLDDIITPELNRELVGEDDEPITVKVHDIKEKEHIPGESVIFLDINPPWSGSIIFRVNDDIKRFIVMVLGYKKIITIAWNKRTESIHEPKQNKR